MEDMSMSETLVSFKTAKLAKEKGFEAELTLFYNGIDDTVHESPPDFIYTHAEFERVGNHHSNNKHWLKFCLAPTQSLLQKWLREECAIIVTSIPNFFNKNELMGYIYTLDKFINGFHDGKDYDSDQFAILGDKVSEFNTYEEALEAGLFEALKLIKL